MVRVLQLLEEVVSPGVASGHHPLVEVVVPSFKNCVVERDHLTVHQGNDT